MISISVVPMPAMAWRPLQGRPPGPSGSEVPSEAVVDACNGCSEIISSCRAGARNGGRWSALPSTALGCQGAVCSQHVVDAQNAARLSAVAAPAMAARLRPSFCCRPPKAAR
jgi:hypothetical protein